LLVTIPELLYVIMCEIPKKLINININALKQKHLNIGTKCAEKRTFLLPKPAISDFLTHPIYDLFKSVKAGLHRAFALTMT